MTIYSTYQEAKIANPDSHIITINLCEFHAVKGSLATHISNGWDLCNPADFCMTIERFLRDGNRFVDGDIVLRHDNRVIKANEDIGWNDWNVIDDGDDERYILRAAALEQPKQFLETGEKYEHAKALNFIFERLIHIHGEDPNYDYMHKLKNAIAHVERGEESASAGATEKPKQEVEKPKRVKVEYVECDNLQDSLDKFESMSGFEFYPDKDGVGDRINSVRRLALFYGNNSLYLKVERPIKWWEDAADFIKGNSFNIGKQARKVGDGAFYVESKMTREQWCDFARILLEQEGE